MLTTDSLRKHFGRSIAVITLLSMVLASTASVHAATKKSYGTYGNKKFYYSMSKEKVESIEIKGDEFNSSSKIKQWKKGEVAFSVGFSIAEELATTFVAPEISIPYSLIKSIITSVQGDGNFEIHRGSYFSYLIQLRYKTREISVEGKKASLVDEIGRADIFVVFHPVGTGFKKASYSKKLCSNVKVYTQNYYNKKANMQGALANANHRAKTVWRLDTQFICSEKWKRNVMI